MIFDKGKWSGCFIFLCNKVPAGSIVGFVSLCSCSLVEKTQNGARRDGLHAETAFSTLSLYSHFPLISVLSQGSTSISVTLQDLLLLLNNQDLRKMSFLPYTLNLLTPLPYSSFRWSTLPLPLPLPIGIHKRWQFRDGQEGRLVPFG
jgi:hypothetical protein